MRIMKDIIGKEVLNGSADIIGHVKDLEVDSETNEIEAFVVTKGGISESLGLSSNEIIIPFDRISQIGDKILMEEELDIF